MRALAANVNTNRLTSKHPALRHMARLCESTHDQPNLRGDGGEWLDSMPFPAHLSARVVSMSYDSNMTKWVQVKHDELLEYVAMVEYLRKDHTALQHQIEDAKELASIVEATYKARLDQLTDLVLDQHPSNYSYEAGLLRAYNILAGHE